MEQAALTTKRIQWVEISRVIAMLSVIIQHLPKECRGNGPVLTSALAFFFILAGYFSAHKMKTMAVAPFFKKRIFPLLKCYVVWGILCAIGLYLAGVCGFIPEKPWSDFTVSVILGIGELPVLVPMWFVRDLMVFHIVIFFLFRLVKASYGIICILGLASLYFRNVTEPMEWPSIYMFGNFCFGFILADIANLPQKWESLPRYVHVGFVGAFVILIGLISLSQDDLIYTPLTPLGVAAIASAGVLLTGSRLGNVMASVAPMTFFVLGLHVFIIRFVEVFETFTGEFSPVVWWLLAPVIYSLCILIYRVLKRYCPKFTGLLTLN